MKMKTILKYSLGLFVFAVAIVVGAGSEASAATVTKTWTGGGSDDNFSTAANWEGGAAPVATDDNTLIFSASAPNHTPTNDIPNLKIVGLQLLDGIDQTHGVFKVDLSGAIVSGIFSTTSTVADVIGSFSLGGDITFIDFTRIGEVEPRSTIDAQDHDVTLRVIEHGATIYSNFINIGTVNFAFLGGPDIELLGSVSANVANLSSNGAGSGYLSIYGGTKNGTLDATTINVANNITLGYMLYLATAPINITYPSNIFLSEGSDLGVYIMGDTGTVITGNQIAFPHVTFNGPARIALGIASEISGSTLHVDFTGSNQNGVCLDDTSFGASEGITVSGITLSDYCNFAPDVPGIPNTGFASFLTNPVVIVVVGISLGAGILLFTKRTRA